MAKDHGSGRAGTRRDNSDLLGANSEIARKLKRYYDDLVSEEVPDRFAELLSRLERTEGALTSNASKKV